MNNHSTSRAPVTACKSVALLVSAVMATAALGAATELATEPFSLTSTSTIKALPNIMFVLDDSGSMRSDFLPDWAGPYQQMIGGVLTTVTPAHRFFNSAFNGIAYNPATRYRPPVMYTVSGSLDTTTYPSQNGQSTASGGDGTATATLPNWRAVKVDGYGVQSTATVSLEGAAFFYTTIPGEYCDAVNLRNCTAASAATGSYTYAAPLRWCTTAAKAADTTTNAGTACQASNIEPATGITDYTHPRIARPRTTSIQFTAGGTVTSITVGGVEILSASATGLSNPSLAADVAAKVNACTMGVTGGCGTLGYMAVVGGVASDTVTLIAPGATSATPVVTGGSTGSISAFSGGSVPGATLFTVITPTINSYPYPGSATKASGRIDCAGTTCTYAEEMTNYANWYTYYRTRMQMMKTSSSIAFSNVDDKFRVGYFSINNGSGSDFLDVGAFDGSQRNAWYSKFFAAVPFGTTPLRTGLATAGRYYAGLLSTINGQAVDDPMQYSCQQNFTILSTDGYWNDASNPVQLDGSTPIGQQDGNDPRPYYDGATQLRTETQTTRTDEQIGMNQFRVDQRTQQIQTGTKQLTQSVTTTHTYPYKEDLTQLQMEETPLVKSENLLERRVYPLSADTRQLEQRTFQIQRTVRPLERYTYNLTETSYPLREVLTNITKTVSPLQQREQFITRTEFPLQQGEVFIRQRITPLQKMEEFIQRVTYPLQESTYLIERRVFPLQSSTYKLRKSERQLQKRQDVSSDGGDTWLDTGWVNVSSCNTSATVAGQVRNIQCRYDTAVDTGGLSSCTSVAASTGPTSYTVGLAVSCAYETTPVVAAAASCTASSASTSSPYSQYVTCNYASTASSTQTGQSSCTAYSQSTASKSGDKVTCVYPTNPSSVTNVGSCTATATNTGALPKKTCAYSATSNLTQTNLTSCTPVDQSANAAGVTWTGDKSVCSYQSASWASATSCTARTPSPAYSNTRISCQWGAAGSWTGYTLSSCTPNTSYASGDKVECQYRSSPASWSNVSSCTPRNTTDFSQTKIQCQYGSTASSTTNGLTSCTVNNQSTSSPMSGNKVTCAYSGGTWTNVASCTPRDPGTAYNNSKIDCQYGTAGTPTTGNTSCTANAAGVANNTLLSAAATGDKVVCAWDATSTTTTKTSCTWNVPASPTSTRTQCQYAAGTTTGTNLTTCTPVPQSTGTTNGTIWSGPAKTCAYMAAVVTSNLTTCSPTGTNNGTNQYTTCGYGTGVVTNNLNSCTVDPPEPGPSYTGGSTTACAYQAGYSATNVASCTPVAQSGTFAAPQVQCVYAAPVTTTNLSSCTDQAVSGSAPFVGPARTCYYSTTASTTNLNATSCNANRQTTSPYTGPAEDCAYNATAVVTNNVATCTTQAQSAGPSFVGPAVSCAYGAAGSWTDVTSGSCTVAAQSAGPNFTGPARQCAYNGSVTTNYVGTCTAEESTTSPYTILQKRVCTPGSFPVTGAPVVTTVNSCSTDPTSGGSPVVVSTATTCAYQAPVWANSPTCTVTPESTASPYVTANACDTTDTGWVAVAPSCTLAGSVSPDIFDATGKIVECQRDDIVGTTSHVNFQTFSPVTSVPVGSCTAGIDAGTKVQTLCPVMLSTGPDPVASCTTVNPPVAPDYVKTICDTTTTSATVMGCTAQTASSPLWKTVTCAANGTGTYNTLADVAAYYYKTDLRTPALNNCVGAVVPPATSGSVLCSTTDAMNNVPTTTTDNNPAQHMTTFTLGLGASGYMRYSSTYNSDTSGDFHTVKGVSPYLPANGIAADPSNGVCAWQSSGLCNWPFPDSDAQTTIDDLWHAGVNGRGAYFSATDPVSLANSISSTLAQVASQSGAASAAALSNPVLSPGDSYVFAGIYKSVDWTGDVVRITLDPISGMPGSSYDWSVQGKLDAKAFSSRNIWTFDAAVATTKLKAFNAANFAANSYFITPHINTLTQYQCIFPDICLSATDQDNAHASGANLVNYLRGERTNEGAETDNTKYYRQRANVLGDIVNAQIVYVNTPYGNYADPGYGAFKTAQASRQAVAYAAANDGMLHAFAAKGSATTESLVLTAANDYAAAVLDPANAAKATAAAASSAAATAALAADTVVAQEMWAYIPSMVLPHLHRLADKKYRDKHRYYVDTTPAFGDICVSNCTSAATAVWKTILVGGLGRGGRGYYALDITDPANPKALWEFTNANLGYTYGMPQIVKRKCEATDTTCQSAPWVVLLSSGYNNIPNDDGTGGDGVGRLFVLNAETGAQISGISPLSTGAGDVTTPSGLTKITAAVANPSTDATVIGIYGGDLLGNLWRFDINDEVGAAGYEAQLFAVLKDGSGKRQPITTTPLVSLVQGRYIVMLGTGQLLASSDSAVTDPQTLYGLVDRRASGTTATTAIYDNPGGSPRPTVAGVNGNGFVMQVHSSVSCPSGAPTYLCSSGDMVMTSTTESVDYAVDNGWFVDLTNASERANLDPDLALGTLVFNTNAPSLSACDLGGKSYQYWLDYRTGGALVVPGAYNIVGVLLSNSLASAPKLISTPQGLRVVSQTGGGGGPTGTPTVTITPEQARLNNMRRSSWRELIAE